ncbi:type IV secretion system T-DNA border endonuclease VirD2 (plasmid) [Marinibacterium anthonyi]|nr:type IV secretion system T-DNA border endonuclease VirD2 [Marinibacterium anthonyi]
MSARVGDRRLSIQEAVLGDPLEDIARARRSGGGGDLSDRAAEARAIRAYVGNARRVPQSVVKRIRAGGCHSAKELTRQLAYVTREEAAYVTWTNFAGVDRPVGDRTLERVVEDWSSSWRGAPKRGHTDHIILSFPSGVTLDQAEAIARAWGQAIFASGEYGDQWRYVAAVHEDPEHLHAHFVVDKVGCDWGQFLSISQRSELNYDVMREIHAALSRAHGVEMVASSRLSRGIIAYPPRETEYRAAHALHGPGCDVPAPPMSPSERETREGHVRGFAAQYAGLGRLAAMVGAGDAFMARLAGAFRHSAETLERGEALMSDVGVMLEPDGERDVAERLLSAREDLLSEARAAWDNIQAMVPGAERAQLEEAFSRASLDSLAVCRDEPFFRDHATLAEVDPFADLTLASMSHLRNALGDGDPRAVQIDRIFEDLRARLEDALTGHEDRLGAAGTTRDELAEYLLQGEHSVALVEAWEARGFADLAEEAALARSMAAEVEIPRDLQEAVARDQLMSVEYDHSLADLPALQRITDRMTEELSAEAQTSILSGDDTPLRLDIPDPAVRAAVASVMRGEAESETVEAYQEISRAQEAQVERSRGRMQETGRDLDDDYSL